MSSWKNRLTKLVALIVGLRALGNVGKPWGAGTGLVFFGKLLSGWANWVLAPTLGVLMLILAYGMWTGRRFALPLSVAYAVFVTLNVPLFLVFEDIPAGFGPGSYALFGIVGIGGAWLMAWLMASQRERLR